MTRYAKPRAKLFPLATFAGRLAAWFDPVPPEHRALAPAFEAEAITYLWERLLIPLGVAGALSMLAFGVMDWWLYPQHLLSLWLLRLLGLILPYATVAMLARYGRERFHPYHLGLSLQTVLTFTVCTMLWVVDDWTSPYWLLILMASTFACTVPWPVEWAFGCIAIAVGLYFGGSLLLGDWAQSSGLLTFYNLTLFSMFFVGIGAIHRPLMRLRWQNFLRQHQLMEARAALEAANVALQQNIAELEASNAELDAFAHTVAHDLKTPLTALIGFGSLLEQRAARWTPEKIAQNAGRITQTGHKMTRIIHELLLLASVRKADEIALAPLDMTAIIEETLARFGDQLVEANAELRLPETWPTALGYAPWVEEVWVNYLSNALKYGGTPPRVELGFSILDFGLPIVEAPAKIQNPQSKIVFWVQDNGPGLTPEQQRQLFAEFTRLAETRAQGHGLGLSIVQRIVVKLGGEVGVESEMGRGSRFWFTLPRLKDSVA